MKDSSLGNGGKRHDGRGGRAQPEGPCDGFHIQAGIVIAQILRHVVQDEDIGLSALARRFSRARQPGEQSGPRQQCVVMRADVQPQRVLIGVRPATEHFQAHWLEGVGGVYLLHQRPVDGIHHAGVTHVL